MIMEYSRYYLGKRCVVKTDDSYLFRKFTLLVAISNSNSKCMGGLYMKRWYDKRKISWFFQTFIFNKYKDHLIILDNAGSHKNEYVKEVIINSGNKLERPSYLCRKSADVLHDTSKLKSI